MGTSVIFEEERREHNFKVFPYSELVTPFLSYFHWTLCTPFKIVFEEESGLYHCKASGWSYKIPAICCQSLPVMYIAWGCTLSPLYETQAPQSTKNLQRLTYIFYGFYQFTWLILMWKWLEKVPSLLNQGNAIYRSTLENQQTNGDHYQFPKLDQVKRKRCKMVCVLTFLTLLSISSALSFILSLIKYAYRLEGEPVDVLNLEFEPFVNNTIYSFCHNGNDWCRFILEDGYRGVAYFITLIWVGIITMSEIFWHVTLYMATFWALYFKKLVALTVKNISVAGTSQQLFSAIKPFARVTLLVEEFNGIFGIFVLVASLDTVLYKTICFATFFRGGYAPVEVAYLILSTVPSSIMLYFMADVHKLGSTVPNILKRKYLVEDSLREDPQSLDRLHMSLFSQSDALTNIVGFKGCGFFTISFTFLASLIGITITYTVVLIQFSNKSTSMH